MPQDGSNNYQYPAGTPGFPDTTIESNKYNAFIDDLTNNDLNIPRPLHRGGTGASTALQAMINLKGEIANQVVTNYDTQDWQSGSFTSASGATSAPVAGHRFIGFVSFQDVTSPPNTDNIVIQAFDLDSTPPGDLYQRIKKDGVWLNSGAWSTAFVKKSGDTMSGDLIIAKASPVFALDKAASGQDALLMGKTATKARWALALGGPTAESTGNAGSDFTLYRYNDAGAFIDNPLIISRANGTAFHTGDISINKASPRLFLTKPASGTLNSILGSTGINARWSIVLGDAAAESGSNAGSDFAIQRFDDGGAFIGQPLTISRATGLATVLADPTAALGIATKQTVDAKVTKTGDTMTGDLRLQRGATNTGALVFGTGGSNYFLFDGTNVSLQCSVLLTTVPTAPMSPATKDYADLKVAKAGDTMTGLLQTAGSTGTIAAVVGGAPTIMVNNVQGGGNAAMMSFLRINQFIGNFGIDIDNEWKVGGGSYGTVSRIIHHAGNVFANGAASAGYIKFPGQGGALNFILQWGQIASGGDVTVTFPITFPTLCVGVQATNNAAGAHGATTMATAMCTLVSAGVFWFQPRAYTGSVIVDGGNYSWWAWGW